MHFNSVSVYFEDTITGKASLSYAADLAARLGAHLEVIVLTDSRREARLLGKTDARASLCRRVETAVALKTGLKPLTQFAIVCSDLESESLEPGGILISRLDPLTQTLAHQSRVVPVVASYDEVAVCGRCSSGPVLIPFGDEESGLHGAAVGLPLARILGLTVVFYHTTWRDESVDSALAEDHMCQAARGILERLVSMASAEGVTHRTVIETADDVVEGMLHCAMREQSSVIVLARGPRTGLGSYVTQSLAQSPIPVVVAPGAPLREGGVS
ncbi:MAG: universal stress protein [Cyanobacteria bacterium HKST-UBA02]|nr:universal stress protein [Cyanobacteria bacterium HKST-UBA02]